MKNANIIPKAIKPNSGIMYAMEFKFTPEYIESPKKMAKITNIVKVTTDRKSVV